MKKKIFKNFSWKLGGLLLAFALWFHLTTEQQFHKEITVNIDYINIPNGFIMSSESQKSAIVKFTTSGKKLFKLLYFEDVNIAVDLGDFTSPGSYSIRFAPDQVTSSSGLTGVYISFIAPLACDFELIQQL